MSDINGIVISDVLGISKPTTKLIELVSAAIGKVYEPTHIRRVNKAKAEEINLIGETVNNHIHLPIKYSSGDIIIDTLEAQELAQRTGERLLYQEMHKQQNIEKIIDIAYSKLEEEQTTSQDTVEMDWALRFFNSAGDISSEALQKMWGQILAGEIQKPQSYSLRTLDILKNISKTEAELFSKVVNYVLVYNNNFFIPIEQIFTTGDTILKKYDLPFSVFHTLDECGLVSSQGLTLTIKFLADKYSYIRCSDHLYFLKSVSNLNYACELSVHALTKAGAELFTVLAPKTNTEFSDEVMSLLRTNENLITKHDILSKNADGSFQCVENGSEIPLNIVQTS